MNLIELGEMSEQQCREFLERIRWTDGAECPRCKSKNATKLCGPSVRPGLYNCRDCRRQFTVTVGTIFHRSHIRIKQWLMAIYLMCDSRKGVSALQLQRQLGVSYRTAWFMCHRVREAMSKETSGAVLQGIVEVDETYVGGRTRGGKKGRGSEKKAPVLAIVERDGNVYAAPVKKVNLFCLQGEVRARVDPSSRIMTDEWPAYRSIGKWFSGGHDVVRHKWKEYVRGDVSTNTAESFFALLKRCYHGTHHWFSRKHLYRYCNEIAFRWCQRRADPEARMAAVILYSETRLTWQRLVGNT